MTNHPGKYIWAGIRPPHWSPSKITPQQRDEIKRRRGDGETVKALALAYGVSSHTIRTYC